MTRKVRLEEVFVKPNEQFSTNEWLESKSLRKGTVIRHKNGKWIVVEVSK